MENYSLELADLKPSFKLFCKNLLKNDIPIFVSNSGQVYLNKELMLAHPVAFSELKRHYGLVFNQQLVFDNIVYEDKTDIQEHLESYITESKNVEINETETKRKLTEWAIKAIQNRCSDIHVFMEPGRTRLEFRKDGLIDRRLRTTDDYQTVKAVIRTLYDKGRGKQEFSENSTQGNSYGLTLTDFTIVDDNGNEKLINEMNVMLRVEKALYELGVKSKESVQKAVIRVSTQNKSKNLTQLNVPTHVSQCINQVMQQPSGFIIISGPTGSGKSTLAHGALHSFPEGKVLEALEDPVEVIAEHNSLITQTNVNIAEGFESQLKSLMRKDPDGIFIGEMRDAVSAEIAMTAASTGHLVLTTTHANDTILTLVRLKDLGVSYADMGTEGTLSMFIAQRLVPSLCQHCATDSENDTYYEALNLNREEHTIKHRNPSGCEHCTNGITGRLPIIEYLLFDKEICQFIRDEKLELIEPYIRSKGWLSLVDRARVAIAAGKIDPAMVNQFIKDVIPTDSVIRYA
ncbi:GspE/PulE family protein [Photobacterium sp. GB-72]|uniref:GspE/PulE family protein n=1 Tax=Photobacterium sp. GB-72 TaxID=2022105 RepID=UPI00130481E4|nr:ATPase, T2SS/T4P/T4SS family [Photobacterium sp. GB-72]